jgi:ABC-type glycerol-3-phosphate transport system permease component
MGRRTRIAVSVFFGLLTVVLCVLWVRSYTTEAIVTIGISPGPGFMVGSSGGELSVARFGRIGGSVSRGLCAWENRYEGRLAWEGSPFNEILGLRFGSFFVAVPHCIAVAMTAAASAGSLVRWRFSLRTLLFATTLIAVALGLIAWAAR